MARVSSSFIGSFLVWAILVLDLVLKVSGNAEGDALNALKSNLLDPNSVLHSWDATLVNPCTWFHVTCSNDNSVTRVDLGNADVSGQLVPQLGNLPNLQYLELYSNNITGKIPDELWNLTNLVSLDLYLDALTGPIPTTLGNLKKLRFLMDAGIKHAIVVKVMGYGSSMLLLSRLWVILSYWVQEDRLHMMELEEDENMFMLMFYECYKLLFFYYIYHYYFGENSET